MCVIRGNVGASPYHQKCTKKNFALTRKKKLQCGTVKLKLQEVIKKMFWVQCHLTQRQKYQLQRPEEPSA